MSASSYDPPSNHILHSSFSKPTLKKWQQENVLVSSDIVYPVFVMNTDSKQEIKSMPGQFRYPPNQLNELLDPLVKKGLSTVLLFGVLSDEKLKDNNGNMASSDDNPVIQALRYLKKRHPHLLLMADICLCAYTNHGHCGILNNDGSINNSSSIQRIAEMALAFAQNGADVVAPSDMMDGRIGAIKSLLKQHNLISKVAVMSYAAKFASVFYGPFRDAAGSGAKFGDRSLYQLPPASRQLALRAVKRDIKEGADFVMIKPAGPYLDLVRDVKNMVNVPIAVYHVSGEFAQLYHGARSGAFVLRDAVMESVNGFKRAGATIIITYFAELILDTLNEQQQQRSKL